MNFNSKRSGELQFLANKHPKKRNKKLTKNIKIVKKLRGHYLKLCCTSEKIIIGIPVFFRCVSLLVSYSGLRVPGEE